MLFEIGQYVIREKPDNEKLLEYLKFLKDGYEQQLVDQASSSHMKKAQNIFDKKRRGVKTNE